MSFASGVWDACGQCNIWVGGRDEPKLDLRMLWKRHHGQTDRLSARDVMNKPGCSVSLVELQVFRKPIEKGMDGCGLQWACQRIGKGCEDCEVSVEPIYSSDRAKHWSPNLTRLV